MIFSLFHFNYFLYFQNQIYSFEIIHFLQNLLQNSYFQSNFYFPQQSSQNYFQKYFFLPNLIHLDFLSFLQSNLDFELFLFFKIHFKLFFLLQLQLDQIFYFLKNL